MKNILCFLFISFILLCSITGCSSLPLQGIYTEPIAHNVATNTAVAQFDVSYSIEHHLMKQKNKDVISFKLDTMLYTYRLDFFAHKEIRTILHNFFTISDMTGVQQKKNGSQYLGEAPLYAYASFQNRTARLSVKGSVPNHLRFSFLMKDGEKFLFLEGFYAKTIDGNLKIDDYVDGVAFRYDDIKKLYDFFTNEESLTAIRIKRLHVEGVDKQHEDSAVTREHENDAHNSSSVEASASQSAGTSTPPTNGIAP